MGSRVRRADEAEGFVQVVHGAVEGVHELVAQVLAVGQVPPPPALVQAAAVACGACMVRQVSYVHSPGTIQHRLLSCTPAASQLVPAPIQLRLQHQHKPMQAAREDPLDYAEGS